jgi:penicillin-binding protein 1A
VIYRHQEPEQRVLVAPWVAAEMTDLLQTAVLSGTGRAAQIGRPVAGKTGTTQNNHDGWFVGFSSGITTGVWMGRDDSKPVAGLFGGTAPARAFHDFMSVAVAKRPVQQFETQVPIPDWQLEPEELLPSDLGEYINNTTEPLVDEDGNPTGYQPPAQQQQIIFPGPPPPVAPPYGYTPPQPAPGRTPPPGAPAQQPQQQPSIIQQQRQTVPAPRLPAQSQPPKPRPDTSQ